MNNTLNELKIYQKSMDIGEKIWKLASRMDTFAKYSIGSQVVKSVDSISANIAEGYGRFHYNDSIKFYYYARGSAYETLTWLTKMNHRGMLEPEFSITLESEIQIFLKQLNSYISYVKNKKSINPKK